MYSVGEKAYNVCNMMCITPVKGQIHVYPGDCVHVSTVNGVQEHKGGLHLE